MFTILWVYQIYQYDVYDYILSYPLKYYSWSIIFLIVIR